MKYLVNQIKWDTDGSPRMACNLPASVKVDEGELDERGYLDAQQLDDAIADWLCDQFGYCVEGFNFRPASKTVTSEVWNDCEKSRTWNSAYRD